jgi:CheY-like chemotaxis protein
MYIDHTILLVDDDTDDREMLESALGALKTLHKIIEAGNGLECLKKLDSLMQTGELPCLIVLDINMPRMNGKETYLTLKANKNFRNIPIIIFSTSNAEADKRFFSHEKVEYIEKPIQYKALLEAAKKMLSYCNDLHQ